MFEDTASGIKAERRGLAELLTVLRPGDTVIVWRLDRFGRSLKDLIQLVEKLDTIDVGLRSLQENNNIKLATFIAALFYDLSSEKQIRIPT